MTQKTQKKYTCDELGVCNGRAPFHAECHLPCEGPPCPSRYPFAPGTIDYGHTVGTAREWATELLAASIAVAAVFAVIGFALGFVKLPGGLF